jgi:hypothetical protein
MRQYTVVFMEQRMGSKQLTPVEGEGGTVVFAAYDEEAALAHVNAQLLPQMKACARAELSSMSIVEDGKGSGGFRLVDDSHVNPHFQDSYVKYNPVSKTVELDFDSTRTTLLTDLPPMRAFSAR